MSRREEEGVLDSIATFFFGKRVTPEDMVKKWKQDLATQRRLLDRQIRTIEREQNKIKREIKILAQKGEMENAKVLTRELIRSRKHVEKMHVMKAQINSVSMQLQQNLATYKVAGAMKRSTDIMQMMNSMLRVPELQQVMMALATEMEKAGLIDEIIEEALEMEEDSLSEEIEQEISKVFDELNLDLVSDTPDAIKSPKQAAKQRDAAEVDEEDAALFGRYQSLSGQ